MEDSVRALRQSGNADEVLSLVHRTGLSSWSDESIKGLSNVVARNGEEFAESALTRIASRYSDEVAESTLRILRRQTVAWSDQAADGLAKMVNRVGPDLTDAILEKQGGAEFGRLVFEWLDEIGDVSSPRFQSWAEDLTGLKGDGNWSGAMFELYTGANELPTSSIATFQDVEGGKQGMDFILGTDPQVFTEAKARIDGPTSVTFRNMQTQFRRNLGLTGDAARYPPDGVYEYVIRGPYRQDIVDALVDIADQAKHEGNLVTEFGPENIRFIDGPLPWDTGP